jgi:hypothetical protein
MTERAAPEPGPAPRRSVRGRSPAQKRVGQFLENTPGPPSVYDPRRPGFGPHPGGPGHPKYGKKSPTSWRGGWGPLGDPRSKLSKLVRRIEAEELRPLYPQAGSVGAGGLLREVAEWKALSRMYLETIGIDKGSTPRKAASATKVAMSKEAELARLIGKVTEWRPTSGAELMLLAERMKQEEAAKGGAT